MKLIQSEVEYSSAPSINTSFAKKAGAPDIPFAIVVNLQCSLSREKDELPIANYF